MSLPTHRDALPEAVSGQSPVQVRTQLRVNEGMEFRQSLRRLRILSQALFIAGFERRQSALAQPAVSAPASADPNQPVNRPRNVPERSPGTADDFSCDGKSMPDSGAVQDTGAPQDSSGPSSSVPINALERSKIRPKLAGQIPHFDRECRSRTAPNTVMSRQSSRSQRVSQRPSRPPRSPPLRLPL